MSNQQRTAPPEWQEHRHPDGRIYFENQRAGEAKSHKDLGAWNKVETLDGRTFYRNRRTGKTSNTRLHDFQRSEWAEATSVEGRPYYFNKSTGKTIWNRYYEERHDERQGMDWQCTIHTPGTSLRGLGNARRGSTHADSAQANARNASRLNYGSATPPQGPPAIRAFSTAVRNNSTVGERNKVTCMTAGISEMMVLAVG